MTVFRNTLLLGVAVIAVSACGTLPVVPHAIRCDVSTELLSTKCASPQVIPNNATFATLLDAVHEDRQALNECGITVDALQSAIAKCNQQTDEFNKKIDEINGQHGK